MKFQFAILSVIILNGLITCETRNSATSSSSARNPEHTITVDDSSSSLKIEYSGQVTFNDDGTAIEGISPEGWVEYSHNGKKVIAEGDSSGNIVYQLYEEGKKIAIDDNIGKALLAEASKEMVENGLGTNDRVERLYKKGGSGLVLSEAAKMRAGVAKMVYINYLAKNKAIVSLTDPQSISTYLDVVQSINTDMDKSDLLQIIIAETLIPKENFDKLLAVTRGISSEVERMKVYRKLAEKNITSEDQWIKLINETINISSEADRKNLLVEFAGKMNKTEKTKAAYLKAVKTISSEKDRRNTIRALG
jgi:hypothetical protein